MTDFVLIHGAYQGGWIWKFVSERLRDAGHNVLAPTLDGCAERAMCLREGITTETHGEEIARFVYFHDLSNVVLASTSTGGMVMAKAAEIARERVGRIVFLDALALLDGEKIRDFVKRPAAVNTRSLSGLIEKMREIGCSSHWRHPSENGRLIVSPCTHKRYSTNLSNYRASGSYPGARQSSIAPAHLTQERYMLVAFSVG